MGSGSRWASRRCSRTRSDSDLYKSSSEVGTPNGDKHDGKHPGNGRQRRLAMLQPLRHRKLPHNLLHEHHGSRDGSRSQRSENGPSQHGSTSFCADLKNLQCKTVAEPRGTTVCKRRGHNPARCPGRKTAGDRLNQSVVPASAGQGGGLAVRIATLSIGIFLRLRTASLIEIQLRPRKI